MLYEAWVLSLMVAMRTEISDPPEGPPPWLDTYAETAEAIAAEVLARPLPIGRRPSDSTAAVYVVMAWHESRYRPDEWHDGGAGFGLFGTHEKTLGRPVPTDVAGQAEAAGELLARSFAICRKNPLEERLGWYAAGGSGCSRRLELSAFRMHQAGRLLRAHPFAQ